MASNIEIKQGLDVNIAGAPSNEVAEYTSAKVISIYPGEIEGIKPRLNIREGDKIAGGDVLFFDKKNPAFKFRSPFAGTVKAIIFGPRRSLQEIKITVAARGSVDEFDHFYPDAVIEGERTEIIDMLQDSGLLALIRKRPFSKMVDASELPKSIFVNAMANAPFRADVNAIIPGNEEAFQAGLDALTRLTDGMVHLCLDGAVENSAALTDAANVAVHRFSGPHPSGNTSTHIHHIDPIAPGDVVWTISALNVVQIGQFMITGVIPQEKYVVAAGSGLEAGSAKYYKVRIGTPIEEFLGSGMNGAELRVISGDVFSGDVTPADAGVGYHDTSICVLPEDRERHFMGWLASGMDRFSTHRVYPSSVLKKDASWKMGTSRRGSLRAMVLTGIYDKYVPLDLLVDYLTRACLAKDSDEAIELGILGVDPEDFALCSVVCPSKTDFGAIIKRGLDQIEEEGI